MTCQSSFSPNVKWLQSISEHLHQNTHKMLNSSSTTTPKHSRALEEPAKICELLPLSSTSPLSSRVILPPACSDVENPAHDFKTSRIPNSSDSPTTTPSNTGAFPPSILYSSLVSPRTGIPEIHHYIHTVRPNQLQLYSPTEDIPVLGLLPSVFDSDCLPCNNDKPHTRGSALSSPTTRADVKHLPHLFPPSFLQSFPDDIPALCLSPTLSEE